MQLGWVHNVDCLEGMRSLRAKSVDMVFADLPYGQTQNDWDSIIPFSDLWLALKRVCKPSAVMVFTTIQPFTSMMVMSNPSDFRYEMIWKKNKATGFLNSKKRPLRIHENVLVFWSGKHPMYKPQMTEGHEAGHAVKNCLSKTSCYGVTPKTRSWGGKTTRYPTTVIEIPIVNNDSPLRIHPTQKPQALAEWFIKTYTRKGGLILDPTAGSGSTLMAAHSLGRRSIGFEIDSKMVKRANLQIAAAE